VCTLNTVVSDKVVTTRGFHVAYSHSARITKLATCLLHVVNLMAITEENSVAVMFSTCIQTVAGSIPGHFPSNYNCIIS
jgi:hypothetical protein